MAFKSLYVCAVRANSKQKLCADRKKQGHQHVSVHEIRKTINVKERHWSSNRTGVLMRAPAFNGAHIGQQTLLTTGIFVLFYKMQWQTQEIIFASFWSDMFCRRENQWIYSATLKGKCKYPWYDNIIHLCTFIPHLLFISIQTWNTSHINVGKTWQRQHGSQTQTRHCAARTRSVTVSITP